MPCKRSSTLVLLSMTAVASANWTPYWLQGTRSKNERFALKDNFEPCQSTYGCNDVDDNGPQICGPRPIPTPQEYNLYEDQPRRWNTGLESTYAAMMGQCKAKILSEAVAALDEEHHKELQQVWAHNGHGVIVGLPVNAVWIRMKHKNAKAYTPTLTIQSKKNTCCHGVQGRFVIHMEPKDLLGDVSGCTDDAANPAHPDKIPVFQVKIENKCADCGSDMKKGFFLRVRHWEATANGVPTAWNSNTVPPVLKEPVMFEFRSHKDLPCGSSGLFELFLTEAPGHAAIPGVGFTNPGSWPRAVEISLLSRERLVYSKVLLEY